MSGSVSVIDECVRSAIKSQKNIDITKIQRNQALDVYKKMMTEGTMRLEHWDMMHRDCSKKEIINDPFLGSLGGYEEYKKYLEDLDNNTATNFVDAETAKTYHKENYNPVLIINSPKERIGTKSVEMTKALAMNHLLSDGVIHGFTASSLQKYLLDNYGIVLQQSDATDLVRDVNKLITTKESGENPVAKSCRETLQKISIENNWDIEQSQMIADELVRASTKASKDLGKIITELKVKPDDVKAKKRAIKWIRNLLPEIFEVLSTPNHELARFGKK